LTKKKVDKKKKNSQKKQVMKSNNLRIKQKREKKRKKGNLQLSTNFLSQAANPAKHRPQVKHPNIPAIAKSQEFQHFRR
jgi:hypothetical protein